MDESLLITLLHFTELMVTGDGFTFVFDLVTVNK